MTDDTFRALDDLVYRDICRVLTELGYPLTRASRVKDRSSPRPGGGGGVGGGSVRIGGAPAGAELQDLQEVLVAPSASGGGATA